MTPNRKRNSLSWIDQFCFVAMGSVSCRSRCQQKPTRKRGGVCKCDRQMRDRQMRDRKGWNRITRMVVITDEGGSQ